VSEVGPEKSADHGRALTQSLGDDRGDGLLQHCNGVGSGGKG